jgi:hypothetical protein
MAAAAIAVNSSNGLSLVSKGLFRDNPFDFMIKCAVQKLVPFDRIVRFILLNLRYDFPDESLFGVLARNQSTQVPAWSHHSGQQSPQAAT